MTLDNATLAARLQSWQAHFSNEIWMTEVARMPNAAALDAVLSGPPAWVTRDPLHDSRTENLTNDQWGIDALMRDAWFSGRPDLTTIADHCESLVAHHMAMHAPCR